MASKKTKSNNQKLLHYRGFINFRDIGGYSTHDGQKTKYNLVYRSGYLAKLTENHFDYLSNLGIKTICDLRTPLEIKQSPTVLPGFSDFKIINIPIRSQMYRGSLKRKLRALLSGKFKNLGADLMFLSLYQSFVRDFQSEVTRFLHLLTDPENLPLLVHCTAGKDRTGFMCAILLQVLGVRIEEIYQDYLLSNKSLAEFKKAFLQRVSILRFIGLSKNKWLPFFEARREFLDAAFQEMTRVSGSHFAYIQESLQITPEILKKLQNDFVE